MAMGESIEAARTEAREKVEEAKKGARAGIEALKTPELRKEIADQIGESFKKGIKDVIGSIFK